MAATRKTTDQQQYHFWARRGLVMRDWWIEGTVEANRQQSYLRRRAIPFSFAGPTGEVYESPTW